MPKQVANVAVDDYLTTIYRLHHDEGKDPIAVRLADRLGITPPSVAGMLKRLQRNGLVTVDDEKVITLTEEGFQRAEEMVRRHRLAECLLTDVLRIEWWRAYEEAHLLEHGLSDITEPLLIKALGGPRRSPFGYPIPGVPGANREPLSMVTALQLDEGEVAIIDRVFEEDERLLQFFDAEQIRPGNALLVKEKADYRGTMTIDVADRPVIIGLEVADQIWVRRSS